jgi:DNA-binding transcriptional regulator LsrR (DeoR family)
MNILQKFSYKHNKVNLPAVDQPPKMDSPRHRIVSLTGNITRDGSAAFYNVIFNLADKVTARASPLPLPVFATSREERGLLHLQPMK